jgi:hypothetical protein
MRRAREIGSVLVIIVFAALNAGTSKAKKDSSSSSSGSSPVTTFTPTAPPPSPISPVDIDGLVDFTTLGCNGKPANAGCKLLKEFDTADVWVEIPTDQLYFGEAIGIGGVADGKKELFFMQAATGAGAFVGSARTLLTDNAKETADAQKLLVASKAGTSVPGSEAAKFMRNVPPAGGSRTIVRTRGRSHAFVQFPTQTYIRAKGDHIIVVEFTGAPLGHDSTRGPGAALGWVSELFRVR